MAIQPLNTIKNWFKTGLKPSQNQFWETWDSFRHKFEKVPMKDVENLETSLNTKAEKTQFENHLIDSQSHQELFTAKEDKSQKGIAGGYVPLDDFRKITTEYLNIINDLITGGSDCLLSAEQGVILQNQINGIHTLLQSDNVNLDTIQEIADAIGEIQLSFETILVNDLTTGGTTKALTAEMGKQLQETKLEGVIATDEETQIEEEVLEDNKVISRSKLFNWWENIKTKAIKLCRGNDETILASHSIKVAKKNSYFTMLDANSINGTNNGKNNNLILVNREAFGNASYCFDPNKPNGSYTIATLEDIKGDVQNLQQIMENGNTSNKSLELIENAIFNFIDSDNNWVGGFGKGINSLSLALKSGNYMFDIHGNPDSRSDCRFYLPKVTQGGIRTLATMEDVYQNIPIKISDGNGSIAYSSNNGRVNIDLFCSTYNEDYSFLSLGAGNNNIHLNRASINIGSSNTSGGEVLFSSEPLLRSTDKFTFVLPTDKPTDTIYKIATRDEIPKIFSNNSVIDLSSSDLDNIYPDSIIGTKVHCLSIISGASIYEKTELGWIKGLVTLIL